MLVQKLMNLAETAGLRQKMDAMFAGEHINVTEDRAVLHTALRASRKAVIEDEGHNVVPDVWKVRRSHALLTVEIPFALPHTLC